MYYRIAELTMRSEIALPSFAAFECEAAEAEVILTRTDEKIPEGKEIVSGDVIHRMIPEGWFCRRAGNENEGLVISRDYTRLRYRGPDNPSGALSAERYARLALECALIRRGYISLHAAAVELDGEAYAFTGPSGVGKSTRARRWTETFGARLVSGDRPLIYPGRMELYGVPWDGKEQCFRNAQVPLKCLFEVRRGKSFHARELSMKQRRRLLAQQCFIPMWDTETAAVQMRNLFRLAEKTNVLRVFGGRTSEDAEKLLETIRNKTYLKEEPDMKAKTGFILRQVADEYMLMPTDENIRTFNGAVLLNEVSAFVWEKLQQPTCREDLLAAVLEEFEVDEETAGKDLDIQLEKLKKLGLIDE